jgi:hypothetical protein
MPSRAARRQAVDVLRIGESICRYAAEAVADGLTPAEARQAVIGTAGELAELAAALRRLERLCPACGKPVGTTPRPGRPRVYCSDRCRWKRGHEQAAAGRAC